MKHLEEAGRYNDLTFTPLEPKNDFMREGSIILWRQYQKNVTMGWGGIKDLSQIKTSFMYDP